MTNSTANNVEEVVSSLLPDEEYRKTCLSLFAQSLNEANSYGRNKWGVYYSSNEGVRLLVGSIIVCTIHKDGMWLSLDMQSLNERKDHLRLLEKSSAWHWDPGEYAEYKAVPSRNGYYVPSSKDLDLWPVLRDLHFEYLKKVAHKYHQLKPASQRRHTPELLVYLRGELGRTIPGPDYDTTSEPDIFQEIEEFKNTHRELSETERESLVQSRIGQGPFRSDLEKYWRTCAVTGCASSRFLTASHIKPWKNSNNLERLDVYNGLLLVPNLDRAFDRGFISFNDEGKIIISDSLKDRDRIALGIHSGMRLRKIDRNHLPYLEYHRQNVFLKD